MSSPLISVCIPAYNRVHLLRSLLRSITSQDFTDYEIVICEDFSPERTQIRAVVESEMGSVSTPIRYFEHERNFGYYGYLRRVIECATGKYCLFMGNDDILADGALSRIARAITEHKDVGVILRSYAIFDRSPDNVVETCRYCQREILFSPGRRAVIAAFRRSVVISGLVIKTAPACRLATHRFDGSLLYQVYLVANISIEMNVVLIPDVIALYRTGGVPEFGSSAAEHGRFTPGEKTVGSSICFMQGMVAIARDVEKRTNVPVFKPIVRDIANYAYPILAIHADHGFFTFLRYGWRLGRLGLARHPMFLFWLVATATLGTRLLNAMIKYIKLQSGHTPLIGRALKS